VTTFFKESDTLFHVFDEVGIYEKKTSGNVEPCRMIQPVMEAKILRCDEEL
jgi:hypothetical protein